LKYLKLHYKYPNKSVYCEVYVHFTYNFNGQQLLGFKPYRLRAPITSIEYIGNEQCDLKYGSTFKYTFLHTQDIKTGKYQNSQTLCTCNYENITYGYLPSKLYYGTPKQRFQFVTSSGCQFFAYYDVVISTELDIVIKH